MRLSHSTSITPHSAYILVDIQPATVERLNKSAIQCNLQSRRCDCSASSAPFTIQTYLTNIMDQDDVLHVL